MNDYLTSGDAKPTDQKHGMSRRSLLSGAAMLPVLLAPLPGSATNAVVQQATSGFSFAVYGDSRSMMYLPRTSRVRRKTPSSSWSICSSWCCPKKIAEDVVRKDVKFVYDPAKRLPGADVSRSMTASQAMTLTVDKGWVTEASVEDVKLLPGVRRTMFRLNGGEWVAHSVVKDVQNGRAKFILNTGDMVWWGKQGPTPSKNPYWTLVYNDVLKQLPPPDESMQAAGLPGSRLSRGRQS